MNRRAIIAGALGIAGIGAGITAPHASGSDPACCGVTAPVVLQPPDQTTVPFVVQGLPGGQPANLTEWQDNDGTVMAAIDAFGRIVTRGLTVDDSHRGPGIGPEIHYIGPEGVWRGGIDSASNVQPGRDFVLAAKADFPNSGETYDLVYCSHNGATAPTVGIGITDPGPSYRLQVMNEISEPQMGGLAVRTTPGQTGKAFAVGGAYSNPPFDVFAIKVDGSVEMRDPTGALSFAIGTDGVLAGTVKMRADATLGRPLRFVNAAGKGYFDFQYTSPTGTEIEFVNNWTGLRSWRVTSEGRFRPLQVIDSRFVGIQLPHAGSTVPTGGLSGEIRVGTGKLWVNDGGVWKSIDLA